MARNLNTVMPTSFQSMLLYKMRAVAQRRQTTFEKDIGCSMNIKLSDKSLPENNYEQALQLGNFILRHDTKGTPNPQLSAKITTRLSTMPAQET